MKLDQLVDFEAGILQNRIKEVDSPTATEYLLYGQQEFQADMEGIEEVPYDKRIIRTEEKVTTLQEGNIVFSFLSGKAAIVGAGHHGYFYAQSYAQIHCNDDINSTYLIYLLNEDLRIRKQLAKGLQGSMVLKYTLTQIKELEIESLPNINEQKLIGSIYQKTMRLEAIKKRVATNQKIIVLEKLKEKRYGNK